MSSLRRMLEKVSERPPEYYPNIRRSVYSLLSPQKQPHRDAKSSLRVLCVLNECIQMTDAKRAHFEQGRFYHRYLRKPLTMVYGNEDIETSNLSIEDLNIWGHVMTFPSEVYAEGRNGPHERPAPDLQRPEQGIHGYKISLPCHARILRRKSSPCHESLKIIERINLNIMRDVGSTEDPVDAANKLVELCRLETQVLLIMRSRSVTFVNDECRQYVDQGAHKSALSQQHANTQMLESCLRKDTTELNRLSLLRHISCFVENFTVVSPKIHEQSSGTYRLTARLAQILRDERELLVTLSILCADDLAFQSEAVLGHLSIRERQKVCHIISRLIWLCRQVNTDFQFIQKNIHWK